MLTLVVGKGLSVPNGTFIEEQIGSLRIPIAGNIQNSGGIEIVFDKVAGSFWFCILIEAHANSRFVRVHNSPPRSIEANHGTSGYICNEG
jgi:hypothetical protein